MTRGCKGGAGSPRFGTGIEGGYPDDEEAAVKAIKSFNYSAKMMRKAAKEERDKEKIKAKITLPKLKWMGQI